MPTLKETDFEPGSYSDRSIRFFDTNQWETARTKSLLEWKIRTTTWAHYPYRYWLEQSGVKSKNLFGHTHITHKMFQVALMSAARTLDGLHELERWYIIQPVNKPEQVIHFSHLVQKPELESASGELNKNFDFILNNNLYVPNTEDLVRLDTILELGRLDGHDEVRDTRRD